MIHEKSISNLRKNVGGESACGIRALVLAAPNDNE